MCLIVMNFLLLVSFAAFSLVGRGGSGRFAIACGDIECSSAGLKQMFCLLKQMVYLGWRIAHRVVPCCARVGNNGLVEQICHCAVVFYKPIEYLDTSLINCISVSGRLFLCWPAVRIASTAEPQACK